MCYKAKSDEDVEDLDEDVYCSSDKVHVVPWVQVGMNPEHPKFKPFIQLQFTTLNVNEVAPVVTAVVCMLIKF